MMAAVLRSVKNYDVLFKMLAFKIELISLFAFSEQFFSVHVGNVFKANFK